MIKRRRTRRGEGKKHLEGVEDPCAEIKVMVGNTELLSSEFIRPGVYTADDLTMRERLFVEYYLRHGVVRRALREAGMSEHENYNILSLPRVKQVLRRELGRIREATIADRLERKAILTSIARGNVKEFLEITEGGHVLGIKIDPDAELDCLKEISIATRMDREGNETTTTKLKLDDRLKAIDLLNKMDGVYVQKVLLDDDFEFNLDADDEGL